MTDLDDEAQAKIEEMMYNQRQKQLGLPQSHELVRILRAAEIIKHFFLYKSEILVFQYRYIFLNRKFTIFSIFTICLVY